MSNLNSCSSRFDFPSQEREVLGIEEECETLPVNGSSNGIMSTPLIPSISAPI